MTKSFLAGALSGSMSTLLLQPLDLVKTRLQTSVHIGYVVIAWLSKTGCHPVKSVWSVTSWHSVKEKLLCCQICMTEIVKMSHLVNLKHGKLSVIFGDLKLKARQVLLSCFCFVVVAFIQFWICLWSITVCVVFVELYKFCCKWSHCVQNNYLRSWKAGTGYG